MSGLGLLKKEGLKGSFCKEVGIMEIIPLLSVRVPTDSGGHTRVSGPLAAAGLYLGPKAVSTPLHPVGSRSR